MQWHTMLSGVEEDRDAQRRRKELELETNKSLQKELTAHRALTKLFLEEPYVDGHHANEDCWRTLTIPMWDAALRSIPMGFPGQASCWGSSPLVYTCDKAAEVAAFLKTQDYGSCSTCKDAIRRTISNLAAVGTQPQQALNDPQQ